MFFANFNDNKDLLFGKFAGNRLSRYDVIRPTTTFIVKFITCIQPHAASTLIIRSWLIYFYKRCN